MRPARPVTIVAGMAERHWVRIHSHRDPTESPQEAEERLTAGIYGVIVSSAVMTAAHVDSVGRLAFFVLVTLSIYWAAERYARVMAALIAQGHRLSRHQFRTLLTHGWEIVTTSVLPLVVLVTTGQLGADISTSIFAALVVGTALLCLAGWEVGRSGHLTFGERVASAAVAGTFGVLMILLKALLH